jgi:hypothetical protein
MLGKEHAKVYPKNVVGPDDMLRVWPWWILKVAFLSMFEPL